MSKKNGYLLYVDSRKSELEAEGHDMSAGYPALVPLCSDGWNALPDHEKQRFNEEAKRLKESRNEKQQEAPTSSTLDYAVRPRAKAKVKTGPTYHEVRDPKMFTEEEKAEITANREIVKALFQSCTAEWRKEPIVVCSFSVLVQPGHDLVYLPAEIGLAAFDIKNGLLGNYGRVIDPGHIPSGHGIEAFQTAAILGLPQLGSVFDFKEYESLMHNIEDFLYKFKGNLKGGNSFYVFCFDSDFLLVSRCFQALLKITGYDIPVKILSLDQYAHLASTKGRNCAVAGTSVSPHRTYRKSLLGSFIYCDKHPQCTYGVFDTEQSVDDVIREIDNYKYYYELSCIYHTKGGNAPYLCALSMSNRYVFSLLEILTLSNDVEIILGGHYPDVDNSENEKQRRFDMISKWGITKYEDEMEINLPVVADSSDDPSVSLSLPAQEKEPSHRGGFRGRRLGRVGRLMAGHGSDNLQPEGANPMAYYQQDVSINAPRRGAPVRKEGPGRVLDRRSHVRPGTIDLSYYDNPDNNPNLSARLNQALDLGPTEQASTSSRRRSSRPPSVYTKYFPGCEK